MAPSPEIAYGLETPYPLQPSQNYVRLEGWALMGKSPSATRTRLKIGEEVFHPESTPERQDVAVKFSDDPHARHTGFVYVCYLPFGNHIGRLEASGDDGETWHLVKSLAMPVSSHPLMGQFEPAGTEGLITTAVCLAGWCWHPELVIEEVVLLMGNIAVPVEFGLERPDVAQRFPEQPEARQAGFITVENLPRGQGKIRLRVTTTCGRIYYVDPKFRADIKEGAYLPPQPPPEMWKLPPAEVAPDLPVPHGPAGTGSTNILFVLFGDFTSNSAYHVTALANALIAQGYDCIVAVPDHAETIEAQPNARFLAIEFGEISHLSSYFSDGLGPQVTHVWTTRERVRHSWMDIRQRFDTDLVIHLEDNERELLRDHLEISDSELSKLTEEELESMVPPTLSNPLLALEFMKEAKAATTIVESLTEFIPQDIPHITFWPAATPAFRPLERNLGLRRKLGIPDEDTVVFYHGNVHGANTAEVLELYRAIDALNHTGLSTWLIRTGRDHEEFIQLSQDLLRNRLINIGYVKRAKDLPQLMSMADLFVQPGSPGAFNDYRFPSKLPEFFAIGRPVILPASNLGRIVTDRVDAYVLAQADAPAISSAVQHIVADKALRKTLSDGAIAFAHAHFSWEQSARKLTDFYTENTRLQPPTRRMVEAANTVNASYT